MKKIVLALVVLLFASPAWADVIITAAQVGETNEVIISYDASGEDPDLPRAFGLDIQLDNDANILEVTPMVVGESVLPDNLGFGIFPGTIQIDAEGHVTDDGTPVAPSDDPGALPGLDSNGVTIELASLYAPTGVGSPNAPPASGDLVSVFVSKSCTLCITANVPRAGTTGVVMEDPDLVVTVNLPVCIEVNIPTGPPPCFSEEHADHAEWVAVGQPESWCYKYQCYGDADGKRNGSPFTGYSRVRVEDLNILISGWKIENYVDPETHPWIAADFDRKLNGSPFTGYSRIRVEDLNILVSHWKDDSGIPMENPGCGGDIDLTPP